MKKFLIVVLLIVFAPITIPCGIIYLIYKLIADGLISASQDISYAKNRNNKAKEMFESNRRLYSNNSMKLDLSIKGYAKELCKSKMTFLALIMALLILFGIPVLFCFVLLEPLKQITGSSFILAVLMVGTMGISFYLCNSYFKKIEKKYLDECISQIKKQYKIKENKKKLKEEEI